MHFSAKAMKWRSNSSHISRHSHRTTTQRSHLLPSPAGEGGPLAVDEVSLQPPKNKHSSHPSSRLIRHPKGDTFSRRRRLKFDKTDLYHFA